MAFSGPPEDGVDRRRFLQTSAAAVAGCLTADCTSAADRASPNEWTHYKGDAGFTGATPDQSVRPPLKLLWSYRLDGDASNDAGGGPIVADGKLFLPVVNTRSVIALDADTGRFVWQYDGYLSGQRKVPTFHGGRLLLWELHRKTAAVLALDAATGRLLWQQPLQAEGSDPNKAGFPAHAGKVYCSDGGEQPTVKAFDIQTGTPAWKTPLGKEDGLCAVCPTVAGGKVFVGTRTAFHGKKSPRGATIALDAATGKELWRRTDVFPFAPLVSDGRVVACTPFASPDERFHLLDAANGRTLWTVPRSGLPYAPAVLLPDRVLIKPYGSDFSTLDRASGKRLHQFSGHGRSGCCAPSVSGAYTYVGTGVPPPTGDLEALNAFQLVHAPREKGLGGTLYVVDLKTGQPVWRFATGNTICGEPALAYGRLYFASRDGKVYCFVPATEGEPTTPEARDTSAAAGPEKVQALLIPARADPPAAKSWPMAGGNPERTGMGAPALPLPLEMAWSFDTRGRVYTSAALRGGHVFGGSDSGKLVALEAGTGKLLWEKEAGAPIRCSAAAADGLVFAGSDGGSFFALDEATGREKWRFDCGGPVQSAPAVVGGLVIFGANDHNVYALDRQTGRKLWSFRMNDYCIQAPVAVHGNTVFAGQWTDWVWALDIRTGKERWRSFFPVGIEAVAHYRDRLYVRTPYYIVELDPASGKRLRIGDASYGYGALAFVKNRIYQSGVQGEYGTNGAHVTDLDQDGQPIKQKIPTLEGVLRLAHKSLPNFPELAAMVAPLILGEAVCFATRTGKLIVTDPTGKQLWTHQLPGPCHSPPVAVEGLLVVGCDDGRLYAFRPK